MSAEWKAWVIDDPLLTRRGDRVLVRFDSHPARRQRKHEVEVIAHDLGWELTARGTPHASGAMTGAQAWRRNRTMNVTQFVITEDDMWVSGWVPYVGANADEFLYVLHQVAAEADRYEYLSTGADAL